MKVERQSQQMQQLQQMDYSYTTITAHLTALHRRIPYKTGSLVIRKAY